MKKSTVVACWIAALVSPFAAHAMSLDYPALGIKLTNLPDSTKSFGFQELLKEDVVGIQFDERTSAMISRRDEPVPQGDIADKGYRDALLKQLGIHPMGRALPMLLIAGQPAWATCYAQHIDPVTQDQCAFYLVVGEHLYEIAVSAIGEQWAARKRFDAAAKEVTSGLVFEPVQPLPERPLAPGEMPKFLMESLTTQYYPPAELSAGGQAVVAVEFSIDGQGTAQGVRVTNRPTSDFSKATVSILKSGGFKIPETWVKSGASKQSFMMEFRFGLGLGCMTTLPPSKLPARQVVTICAGDPLLLR